MSQDLIQGSVARRLLQTGGRWLLEIEYIQEIAACILRPLVRATEGAPAILDELTKLYGEGELVAGAQRLMQNTTPEDRAFQPHHSRWVQVTFSPPIALPGRRGRSAAGGPADELTDTANKEQVDQLAAAHDKLMHTIDALRARVRQLEQRASSGQHLEQRMTELVGRTLRLEHRVDELAAKLASGEFVCVKQPEQEEAAGESQPEPVRSEESETRGVAPDPLHFPDSGSINDSLQQLVGETVGVTELAHNAIPKFGHGTLGWFVSTILDDEGRVVGAMVADSKATVQIGGSLMMLPAAELQAQARTRRPSEDVVAAMSEVFNTFCAVINIVPGNPHIRTNPLEAFEFDKLRWVTSPAERLDLGERAGGVICLLSRDPLEVLVAQ